MTWFAVSRFGLGVVVASSGLHQSGVERGTGYGVVWTPRSAACGLVLGLARLQPFQVHLHKGTEV